MHTGTLAFDERLAGGRLRIDILSDAIFRVRFTLEPDFGTKASYMVLPQPAYTGPWSRDDVGGGVRGVTTLKTPRLTLQINRATAALTWLDAEGRLLTREPARGGKHLEKVPVERRVFDDSVTVTTEKTVDGTKSRTSGSRTVLDRYAYQTKLEFEFADGEALYGLGQHEDGILNYRGRTQYLYQQNMKVAMPVLVSSRGWALLLDTAALATFHDDEHGSYFWTDTDDELDYYFLAGPTFDQLVAGLRRLTGKPTMLPRWSLGYIQSKERYNSQQELLDITREFRQRQIPLDCIVQDWHTWVGELWGDKNPDPERYPDISALTKDLHALNTKLMVSIWPIMKGEGQNQVEMRGQGFLLGNDATYDAFNPAARALYWQQADRGWFQHDIDAWWCDCTEPFEADWAGSIKPEPWKRVLINTTESKTYLDPEIINAYSMLHSQGIYEHQRAANPAKRVLNLTRSGFPGQHRYGTVTWSGDLRANWEVFRRQIADGLNFTVTGNPRWTFDIGAFFVAQKEQWFWQGDYPQGVADAGYRELYVRWLQLGAFLPMFRSHGTDTPREPWRFGNPGDPAYDAIVKFITLRYQLLPYLYSTAAAETLHDDTLLRMLAFDFRDDPRALNVADQFMCGRALLVCPVTHPMYFGPDSTPLQNIPKSRDVYLPGKLPWFNFWTNARHDPGQTIRADAPLDILPLFVKAGSILPLGPALQHTGDLPDAPLELRIYPGADAAFALYEDAGDGYGYESGEYATTSITWCDHARQLALHPRQGTFPGIRPPRPLTITVIGNPTAQSVPATRTGPIVLRF